MNQAATKADVKRAETEAYQASVASAVEEAKRAAADAYSAFAATARRSPTGQIADTCGFASVKVRKPSYRFREALKALGAISKGFDGTWTISRFTETVDQQTINGQEAACEAACQVLRRHFPDEDMMVTSHVD